MFFRITSYNVCYTKLLRLYVLSTGRNADPAPPEGVGAGSYLEGGIPLGEALTWARGKPMQEILELAIAMEANALDRYIKMGRAVEYERPRMVFLALAREEQAHLTRMASFSYNFV